MADSKISALPASTTPLAGTEVLPIVQSSTTRQVSVANLTAGRAISATQLTLTTGNLIVASGQGIDFSATPGTGTSELLADYEEGTWTIADASGASLVLTVTNSTYTKVGRSVFVQFYITYPVTASVLSAKVTLPYTAVNFGQITGRFEAAVVGVWQCQDGTATAVLNSISGGAAITNASLSGQFMIISGVYQAT
jgi:hypothetical protein